MKKKFYRRILLKLSGEILKGSESFGIDMSILQRLAWEIKELIDLNIQIGLVVGGGNLFRGIILEQVGMNRIASDYVGMLATIINGLAIRDTLHRTHIDSCLISAIPINRICDNYSWVQIINLLHKNCVVIFSAGTGNPFFTTDSAACLRGIEIEADVILKATKVDGVFTSDPNKDSSAVMYDQLTYNEVIEKNLKVMDLTAFALAHNYKLPIHVFNINRPGALLRIIMGEKEGTLIKD